jgi:hypothetical protein
MRAFLLGIDQVEGLLAIINVPKEVFDLEVYVRGQYKVKEILYASGAWEKGLKVGEKLNVSHFDVLPDWSETTSRNQLIHIIFSELIP